MGGSGGPVGVTAADGAETSTVPTVFVAVTVKMYDVPLESPVTTALRVEPSAATLFPPGLEITVYPVMVLPPFAGEFHVTVALLSPGVAVTV